MIASLLLVVPPTKQTLISVLIKEDTLLAQIRPQKGCLVYHSNIGKELTTMNKAVTWRPEKMVMGTFTSKWSPHHVQAPGPMSMCIFLSPSCPAPPIK